MGGDVSFSITLASLYTVFNSDFLSANNITCIVNMAGCSAWYYSCDLDRYPEYMEGVKNRCGYNIKKLIDDGEEGLKHFYKEKYGIDWLAIEGACDNWYYNIGQHFAQTNAFLEKHLQEHNGKGRANIVVSCYAGYNRSASVAVAFLLSHFQDMSLEEILRKSEKNRHPTPRRESQMHHFANRTTLLRFDQ